MDTHEHTLRKSLRDAIEQAMTADLSIGDAVEVATMAADIYATAVCGVEEKLLAHVYVVSWPMPTPQEPAMRQAKGFVDEQEARMKASSTDGAEIFILEIG